MDLANTSALLTEENSFRIERKAINSVCSFILISCWHDLKNRKYSAKEFKLTITVVVCPCTHSLFSVVLLALHSSASELSLGSSPISLSAPPPRRSSFSHYVVFICVLSKQPAFTPVIAPVMWLNCLSFLIEGTVLHLAISMSNTVSGLWWVCENCWMDGCLTQVFWGLCKTLWKPSYITLIMVLIGDNVPFGSPGFLVNNKCFSFPWSLEVIDGGGRRECC